MATRKINTTKPSKLVTTYSYKRHIMKKNVSTRLDMVVPNCIYHMQKNHYKASIAEIHCKETGKLYAVITRNVRGEIKIIYKEQSLSVGLYIADKDQE